MVMKKKYLISTTLLIVFTVMAEISFAIPEKPLMILSKLEQTITVSWASVSGASGYKLYYADYYNPILESIYLGTNTDVTFDLSANLSYYIAVKAYDNSGESSYSNIAVINGFNKNIQSIDNFKISFSELGITKLPAFYGPMNPFAELSGFCDLDGDGDSDLVFDFGTFAMTKSDEIYYQPVILENLGDGTFKKVTIHNQQIAHSTPSEIEFADFNLDGRMDVIIAGAGYDPVGGNNGEEFGDQNILLLSNLDGTYNDASILLPQEKAFTHSVTVGDVNGDKYPDIYVGNLSDSVHLLLNNKGKGFTEAILPPFFDLFVNSPSLPNGWDFNEQYTAILFVDIDNDGILELVLGALGTTKPCNSKIIDQDGKGNFFENTVIELPEAMFGPTTITVDIDAADISGDGLIDLVLSQTPTKPYYGGYALQILIQNQDGSFTDETQTRISGLDLSDWATKPEYSVWSKKASFSDMDKDGDLDILVTHGEADDWQNYLPAQASRVFYNDGTGHFTHSDLFGYAININKKYHGGIDVKLGRYFGVVVETDGLSITEAEFIHP